MWRIVKVGANAICFPVSHAYFFVGGEAKVYSYTGWGPWPHFPLDLPLVKKTIFDLFVSACCNETIP